MNHDKIWSDSLFVNVKFQVDTDDQLGKNRDDHDVGKLSVSRWWKSTSFMWVPKNEASEGQEKTCCLVCGKRLSDPQHHDYSFELTWRGTCHLDLERPKTIPIGKRMPQTEPCKNMCNHRIESMGALASSGETSSWWSWASTIFAKHDITTAKIMGEPLYISYFLRASGNQIINVDVMSGYLGPQTLLTALWVKLDHEHLEVNLHLCNWIF